MGQYLLESPYSQYDALTSILAKSHRSHLVDARVAPEPNSGGVRIITGHDQERKAGII